jgi:hypothetical protein
MMRGRSLYAMARPVSLFRCYLRAEEDVELVEVTDGNEQLIERRAIDFILIV